MRNLLFSYSIILLLMASSCNFLDVVPDNQFQYEDLFTSRQQAYTALAQLHSALPFDNRDFMPWTMGDDFAVVSGAVDANRTWVQGASIMRGNQSATNSLLNFWSGIYTEYCPIWQMVRECDMFVRNVDRIPDMNAEDKNDWKAQAKFLKGYYLSWLLQMYGPVIITEAYSEGGINDDLYKPRNKVEDCFDYILRMMDEAIPFLKGKRETQFLGQPDQVTAKAIKARVLLLRASPFYNGNTEYYSTFLDHNGEHFFAQTEDREKWKSAADAAQEGLRACEQYGFRLYTFKGRPYDFDSTDYRLNPVRMKTLYDLRFRIVERWNEELIWGNYIRHSFSTIAAATISPKPAGYGGQAAENNGEGWMQSSYQAMERFYTENGLPIDEDRTVNQSALHEIVRTPDEHSPEYAPMRGLMQPAATTINMYMNREPRFYADLGFTGGYYRSHQVRIRSEMYYNAPGGYNMVANRQHTPSTGIAVQKVVHPEVYVVAAGQNFNMYAPYPFIRVADLYLMKAEALNEYSGPSQEVYDAINAVRRRAGIPDVEESYGDDSPWVTVEARNKHKTREGMREIILRERANEFAFEYAHRFWDMQRWKRSVNEFSRPLYGWNVRGADAESFFIHRNIQGRKWSMTDCLWPIDNNTLERNAKLIQNPGW